MSRDIWNPRQYRAYSSHRARPFYELLARVDVEGPAYVVDLGCGPGERTADLTTRWPDAVIEGIDSSLQMITEARLMAAERTPSRATGSLRAEGPAATGDTDLPDAGSRSPASEASTSSPSTPRAEASPDPLTTGVASADPARILDPSTRAASAGRARVADSSTGDAVAVGQGDQPSAVRDETSSGLAADAPATVDGGTRDRVGGTRERVGGAVRPGGSSPALPEAGKDGGSSRGLPEAGKDGGSSAGLPEADQGGGELRFSVGDLAEWMPDRPVDVIFSNAALQWVPGHRQLLPRWVEALAPGGRLAFSMPGNFEAPSHRVLRELCESPRWRDRLGQVNRHDVVGDPADYFKLLSDLGCEVDAWETTYVQVLHGADPVLEWMKGTALRPAFDALPDEAEREEFVAELTALLREAYPSGPYGTLFPFRRIFVVAGPAKSASGAS